MADGFLGERVHIPKRHRDSYCAAVALHVREPISYMLRVARVTDLARSPRSLGRLPENGLPRRMPFPGSQREKPNSSRAGPTPDVTVICCGRTGMTGWKRRLRKAAVTFRRR